MSRVWTGIGVILVGSVLCAGLASANSPPTASGSTDEGFKLDPALGLPLTKLGRGVGNILVGWVEIPATMHSEYTERDPVTGLVTGFFKGLVKGVIRTLVGAFETITFPFPIPEHYAPILPPVNHFEWPSQNQ